MAIQISDLYAALQSEVERASNEKKELDKTDELSEVLSDAIRESLTQIKLGAASEEFTELAIINFIILASSEGYDPGQIKNFVGKLKPSPSGEPISYI